MKRLTIAGGVLAILLVLLVLAVRRSGLVQDASLTPTVSFSKAPSTTSAAADIHSGGTDSHSEPAGPGSADHREEADTRVALPDADPETAGARQSADTQGFLYGRITTIDGATYEGRLRFGGDQEAFWGDYFNGAKRENPWIAQVPQEQRPKEHYSIEIFGWKLADRERPMDVSRPFMARIGDISRIEARGRDVKVALKSGTAFVLDRFEASDFDDGLRVWDSGRGVVDLDSRRIRTVEFLPTPSLKALPYRLRGTVRTRQGDFTGSVQWNREECTGSDELDGDTADGGEISLRFDTIRTIVRRTPASSLVTLLDRREIKLYGTPEVGLGNRGVYVDDPRYGRVLISWDAFDRIDFGPAGSGPAYGDFPGGRPLKGTVTLRSGDHLRGRLVFDLDESETTETLDAPSQGVDYTIPFGLVASIVRPADPTSNDGAKVALHDGEVLQLERMGDLGQENAGMLIFVEGSEQPEYVPWADVERVDIDRPPAMYPPFSGP